MCNYYQCNIGNRFFIYSMYFSNGSKILEFTDISAKLTIKLATTLDVKYCPNLFLLFCFIAVSIPHT